MLSLEDQCLRLSDLTPGTGPGGQYEAIFHKIQIDNEPFEVRTIYIGKEDRDKPTLLMTHGNWSMAIGFFRMFKILSEHYRIVAFDMLNYGVNTRSGMAHLASGAQDSPAAAETWLQEWLDKAVGAMDLPDTYFMTGISFGGYMCMLWASMHPEKIDSLFLMSPVGVMTYDPLTYSPYGHVSMADNSRWETKKEADGHLERVSKKKNGAAVVHDLSPCMKKLLLGLIVGGVKKNMRAGQHPEELIEVFAQYYWHMFARPGAVDVTMELPFKWYAQLIHPMAEPDRLGNPACTFPVAMCFGSIDAFASNMGGEALLNMMRGKNDGRVNLFKIEGSTHNLTVDRPAETAEVLIGHFSGEMRGRWEPSVHGSHITAPRPGPDGIINAAAGAAVSMQPLFARGW
jgi:pimeloyl-ACP methyl ester carboxylesterase